MTIQNGSENILTGKALKRSVKKPLHMRKRIPIRGKRPGFESRRVINFYKKLHADLIVSESDVDSDEWVIVM